MESIPTFGEVLAVDSEKELRKLGSVKSKNKAIAVNGIRKIIAEGLYVEKFSLKGHNSYANLFGYIQKLAKRINLGSMDSPTDGLFISAAARYIFALTRADTQLRRSLLGVESHFYRDKEAAKKWRNTILSLIHPDVCPLPEANRATSKLDDIYKGMTDEE